MNVHGVPSPGMIEPAVPNSASQASSGPPAGTDGGYIDASPPGVMADAGNSDKIATTVDDAVSMAEARMTEMEGDTHTSTIGDPINLPGPFDHSSVNGPDY